MIPLPVFDTVISHLSISFCVTNLRVVFLVTAISVGIGITHASSLRYCCQPCMATQSEYPILLQEALEPVNGVTSLSTRSLVQNLNLVNFILKVPERLTAILYDHGFIPIKRYLPSVLLIPVCMI